MVEVSAIVVGGPVVLAGEMVQVMVTVTAPALPQNAAQASDIGEVLAWGSAQLHCQCSINEARIQMPNVPLDNQGNTVVNEHTSFAPCRGESGRVVLSTKPKILFCDLQMMPKESRSFIYREQLPASGPPTYRGQLLKYVYKITIGVQKLGSSIKLMRIPLRVVLLQGGHESCGFSDSGELAPSNPFLHTSQKDNTRVNALTLLQSLSTHKNMSQYNITNAHGRVVRFSIYKSSYRLGEDIFAIMNFAGAEVPCVQYSVTLQSQEVINEECCKRENQKPVVVSYSKVHEVCLNMAHTNLQLPIPLHVTPSFYTDIVNLKWRLHFEFVTSKKEAASDPSIDWSPPSSIDIETMVWDLGITILPTSPNLVAQSLQMTNSHTLKL